MFTFQFVEDCGHATCEFPVCVLDFNLASCQILHAGHQLALTIQKRLFEFIRYAAVPVKIASSRLVWAFYTVV